MAKVVVRIDAGKEEPTKKREILDCELSETFYNYYTGNVDILTVMLLT